MNVLAAIASVLTLCTSLCAPLRAQGNVSARLTAEPARAEIGEPVVWTLSIDATKATKITLPEKDPLPDGSWVLIEPRTIERSSGADPEHVVTRVRWSVISLEAGERALPKIEIELGSGADKHKLAAEAGTLHVASALADKEDSARAEHGFLPPRESTPLGRAWGWIVVGGLVLLIAAWIVARGRRKKHVVASAPVPLERLRALESAAAESPERARETVYGLSRLLRDSVDRWSQSERAGLTDEDWSRSIAADERVPLGVRSAAGRILAAAERVKYAGQVPTRFAIDELLRDARAVLETLEHETLPPPAVPVEVAA